MKKPTRPHAENVIEEAREELRTLIKAAEEWFRTLYPKPATMLSLPVGSPILGAILYQAHSNKGWIFVYRWPPDMGESSSDHSCPLAEAPFEVQAYFAQNVQKFEDLCKTEQNQRREASTSAVGLLDTWLRNHGWQPPPQPTQAE